MWLKLVTLVIFAACVDGQPESDFKFVSQDLANSHYKLLWDHSHRGYAICRVISCPDGNIIGGTVLESLTVDGGRVWMSDTNAISFTCTQGTLRHFIVSVLSPTVSQDTVLSLPAVPGSGPRLKFVYLLPTRTLAQIANLPNNRCACDIMRVDPWGRSFKLLARIMGVSDLAPSGDYTQLLLTTASAHYPSLQIYDTRTDTLEVLPNLRGAILQPCRVEASAAIYYLKFSPSPRLSLYRYVVGVGEEECSWLVPSGSAKYLKMVGDSLIVDYEIDGFSKSLVFPGR